MVTCSDFLREYSDFRDGFVGPERRAELDGHRAACSACGRYDAVVRDGVSQLHGIPPIEPSSDFLPRLQHRIYNLDEERAWWSRADTSGTSAGFVVLLAVLIGAAAWVPTLRPEPPLVTLAPVLAIAPTVEAELPPLFREGPLLTGSTTSRAGYAQRPNSVFFRYTRFGSDAVPTSVASIRR